MQALILKILLFHEFLPNNQGVHNALAVADKVCNIVLLPLQSLISLLHSALTSTVSHLFVAGEFFNL